MQKISQQTIEKAYKNWESEMKRKTDLNYAVEIQSAIVRWKKLDSRSWVFTHQFHEFAEFIGYPSDPECMYIVDVSNPEIVKIVDAINGPYGDAILKVLELKHPKK